jgi:serine phosphatase RsbU (regulator of sigma subunit)
VNGDVAHVAIIDAMGHGIEATLLASVTISALRNARRQDVSLADTVTVVDRAIADTFGPDKFVTAIFGELDTATGLWAWTTCGHPPALILRHGRVVKTLDSVIAPPLGLGLLSGDPDIGTERLEPGDRLLLYTDGVVEARDPAGSFFGLDRLVGFVTKEAAAGRPVAETLRRLNHEILHHQDGTLQDDATTVMIEWLTDEPARGLPSTAH